MAAVVHHQRDRQSLRRSARLTVTDEFWIFPLDDPATTLSSLAAVDCGGSEDHDHDLLHQPRVLSYLPEAHHQLLLSDDDDVALFEDLKGHDHRAVVVGRRRQRRLPIDEKPAAFPPRRSWLLSFVITKSSQRDLLFCRDGEDDDDDVSVPGMTDDSSSDASSDETDEDMCLSSSSVVKPKGVSFAELVRVQHIPHSSTLLPSQRQRMYSSSVEVRQNKCRNKREYRYDGCDWRNATEEWEMVVDMVTGDLVHPVHKYGMLGC
jgi:hypothetical protein